MKTGAKCRRVGRFFAYQPCLVPAFLIFIFSLLSPAAPPPSPPAQSLFDIRGTVCNLPIHAPGYRSFDICSTQVRGPRECFRPFGRLRIFVSGTGTDTPLPGDRIRLRSFLREPSHYLIPGVLDFRKRLRDEGIAATVSLKSDLQISVTGQHTLSFLIQPLVGYLEAFRRHCRERLADDQSGLLLAAFTGDKSGLSDTRIETIRQLGLSHLFVVSGLHVGLLWAAVQIVLARHLRLRKLVALLVCWLYVLLLGAPLSALRAGVTISLITGVQLLGIRSRFLNLIGLTAFILLAVGPNQAKLAGFQLSFLCLLALGLDVFPALASFRAVQTAAGEFQSSALTLGNQSFPRAVRRARFRLESLLPFVDPDRWRPVLKRAAAATGYATLLIFTAAVIQCWLFPLQLELFNQISWYGWLANLIFIPMITLLIPASFLLLLLFSTPVETILTPVIGTYVWLLRALLDLFGGLVVPAYGPAPGTTFLTVYYLCLMGSYFLLSRPWRTLRLPAAVVLLCAGLGLARPAASGLLEITMLDVGQGESLHLRYPDGQDGLIDAGGGSFGSSPDFLGRSLIGRYLWSRHITSLNYLLITHPDYDHQKAQGFLWNAFSFRHFFAPFKRREYPQGQQVLRRGDSFALSGVFHRVLSPPGNLPSDEPSNQQSLVLELTYGRFKALLTGDVDRQRELQIPGLSAEILLKVAHHGSDSSTSTRFLSRVRPQVAFISAGRNNPFNHPSPVVLERLNRFDAQTFVTARDGTVRLRTDGLRWEVLTWNAAANRFEPRTRAKLADGQAPRSLSE